MIVERLKLVNVRAFTEAEFEFGAGMNLLVGVNGVGKSTVLDSLRVLLSHSFHSIFKDKNKPRSFETDDISIERGFLTTELFGNIEKDGFSFLIHKQRGEFIETPEAIGQVRDTTIETPSRFELSQSTNIVKAQSVKIKPIAVFFSPHRSIVSTSKSSSKVAFSVNDSLEPRELQIQEFASWLLTREALAKESKKARAQIKSLNQAVSTFLEGYENLSAVAASKPTLTIEKHGKILDVRQLSDGERGVLMLVFDLSARLATANPNLENALQDGTAVVLIDELDLHLHPKWQREIVHRLETTFPNCQFIATTHSPQIVGEVAPEKIYILGRSGEKPVKPDQSLGMDSKWILKRLMETPERDQPTQDKLNEIAETIEQEEYEQAQEQLDDLRNFLQGDDEDLIRLQTRIDRFTLLNEE